MQWDWLPGLRLRQAVGSGVNLNERGGVGGIELNDFIQPVTAVEGNAVGRAYQLVGIEIISADVQIEIGVQFVGGGPGIVGRLPHAGALEPVMIELEQDSREGGGGHGGVSW